MLMRDPYPITTRRAPVVADVTVPGSKSIANRALVCATLASGTTTLRNVPSGDDTAAMLDCIDALGAGVGPDGDVVVVQGVDGHLRTGPIAVHSRLAGTTSRFVTALCALGAGEYTIDGYPPLRERPMAPLHDALAQLGCEIYPGESWGHLPIRLTGLGQRRDRQHTDAPPDGPATIELPGDISSQYISALMMIAPYLGGLRIALTTPLVSRPYVHITSAVMASFGVAGVDVGDHAISVPAGRYCAIDYTIEPDASSASYMFAAAAVCGGTVGVAGLSDAALQGDAAFVHLLVTMGCTIEQDDWGTRVSRLGPLVGIDVDMADLSDLVPTVAVIAPFATTTTRIRGVGFIRAKESDRLGDLATELRRCDIAATETPDGLQITPGHGAGALLGTHHDHRLAMAFAVLGLGIDGVEVQDPTVVTKSWPEFWNTFEGLVAAP